jgi:hypothetical protein
VESEAVAPAGAEETSRECSRCGEISLYTIDNWPNAAGRAVGTVCRLCSRDRKRDFDRKYRQEQVTARTQSLAELAEIKAASVSVGAVSTTKPGKLTDLPFRELEVTKALRAGARKMGEKAESILAILFSYAEDPKSVHHEWAVKFIVQRAMPEKMFQELGIQAAGVKAGGGGNRPSVTIIVQPATAPAAGSEARVIDITPTVLEESER